MTGTEIRPRLGMTPEARAFYLALAHQSIEEHATAMEAVRLLESVAGGSKIHAPRFMARQLRDLAAKLEDAA